MNGARVRAPKDPGVQDDRGYPQAAGQMPLWRRHRHGLPAFCAKAKFRASALAPLVVVKNDPIYRAIKRKGETRCNVLLMGKRWSWLTATGLKSTIARAAGVFGWTGENWTRSSSGLARHQLWPLLRPARHGAKLLPSIRLSHGGRLRGGEIMTMMMMIGADHTKSGGKVFCQSCLISDWGYPESGRDTIPLKSKGWR